MDNEKPPTKSLLLGGDSDEDEDEDEDEEYIRNEEKEGRWNIDGATVLARNARLVFIGGKGCVVKIKGG